MVVTTTVIRREGGVALITAMLVVAISTILAVGMVSRQQLEIRRTENLLLLDQARLYLFAVEDHAKPLLQRYWGDVEFLTREEYEEVAKLTGFGYQEEVDGGTISLELQLDLQGKINLNNLVKEGVANSVVVEIMRRLVQRLQLDSEPLDAIIDWLDRDQESTFPGGAEDGDYLVNDPPYRAGNRRFVDISELNLVKGIDSEYLDTLLPYITVLPEGSKMNVNWVRDELLQALTKDLNTQIDIDFKEENSFKTVEAFLQHQQVKDRLAPDVEQLLAVSNEYFLVHSSVEQGRLLRRYQSLFKREAGGDVLLLGRSRGGL